MHSCWYMHVVLMKYTHRWSKLLEYTLPVNETHNIELKE